MNSSAGWKTRKLLSMGGWAAALLLGACSSNSSSQARSVPTPGAAEYCSARAIVHLRDGAALRNDRELVDVGQRHGVVLEVVRAAGPNARVIMVRAAGPQSACEAALDQLSGDLLFDSIQR